MTIGQYLLDHQPWILRRSETRPHEPTFHANATDRHYQRDRARIIHSATFRALQAKTQIMDLGLSDFYRTRLTHTMEVMQVGSGILGHLHHTYHDHPLASALPSQGIIESAGLAHDLGHPPYGHSGEVALNYVLRHHGGYEGNAQTLRIIGQLGEYSESFGLDLTRRTTLAAVKYPATYGQLQAPQPHLDSEHNLHFWHPPKCIYDADAPLLDWLLAPFCADDQARFREFSPADAPDHGKSHYKSLDCSIMEIADDIAYAVHDLEDAIAMQLITREQWLESLQESSKALPPSRLADQFSDVTEGLFHSNHKRRKQAISLLVHDFISHVQLIDSSLFSHPLLRLQVRLPEGHQCALSALKQLVFQHVIELPSVQATRVRGQRAILTLFQLLHENPSAWLTPQIIADYPTTETPERMLGDFIAAQSDLSAEKILRSLGGV